MNHPSKTPIAGCHFNDVLAVVLEEFHPTGVTWKDMQGRERSAKLVFARRCLAYLAYTCTHLSYPEVVLAMYGRAKSHSTTVDQARLVCEMIARNETVDWGEKSVGMRELMADLRQDVADEVKRRQGVRVA